MTIILDIKVFPQSGKQFFKLNKNDHIACYIKSPPERGLANDEVLKLIAKLCKITLTDVTIIGGSTSRNKRIKIETSLSIDQVRIALGLTKQLNLFN